MVSRGCSFSSFLQRDADSDGRLGFRHLPLHDSQMSQYLFSTLFVNIGIRDV
jgi:hypothetical protein